MKSIWKGSLSFGLVSIRVRLYSAVQEHVIGFKLLHKKCQEPIAYQRWCNHCDKQVPWEDIVKGLKLDDGSYFILTQEKLKELKPKTTETIDIVEFVVASQIESIYLEHHYYLAPEKGSENPFFLFRKALEEAHKVAIGTFVMRDKQYTCVINPYQEAMLLTTLNYGYEIRPLSGIAELQDIESKKINPAELKLAMQLVNQLTVKKFNISEFKDTFAQQLKEEIKKGTKGKKPSRKKEKEVTGKKKKEEPSTLAARLKASLRAPGREAEVAHAKSAKSKRK